jgi:hypothetical protein
VHSALSPHYDDHDGSAVRALAAGAGHGCRTAASTGHHHRGWAHCQPGADAFYYTRGVLVHGSPAVVGHTSENQR